MGPGPRLILLAFVLVLPAFAGCFGGTAAPISLKAYLPLNDAQPGRGTEFLLLVNSTSAFKQTAEVTAAGLPNGWTFQPEVESLELAGKASVMLIVRITPDMNATYGPHNVDVDVGGAGVRLVVNIKDLGREPLRAGIGTQLYYVGAYVNGTLFGYNEPTIAERGLPYAPPGESDPNETIDFTPLKVYVGGQRGTPPPEPYNGSGYLPVITGFDARLRDAGNGQGMLAGETLAVRVPKEQAYTAPGREDHPLYGEDMTFLIRIVSVDILRARTCDLPVCP